jgi:hypothetical protein
MFWPEPARKGGSHDQIFKHPETPHQRITTAHLEASRRVAVKGETASATWDHGTAGHEDRMGTATHPVTKLVHYRINDIYGEDSLQSLSLAVEMVHRRLASLVEAGEQLMDSEGGEFSLKAYFRRPTALQ